MKSTAAGIKTIIVIKILMLIVRPKAIAAIKHIIICITAIGSRGRVYPRMKSDDFIGEIYSLNIKELVLSLAISIPENREINERPNTEIPGVR